MNFRSISISELGAVVTGKTPSTNNESYYGDEYMFLGPKDLHKHFMITDSEKMITESGLKSIKGSVLDGLSILVGCIGWDMGNVGLVDARCATNQQINSITNFKQGVNPLYVYYWLKGKKDLLFQKANVTRTPILNKTEFSKIKINLPGVFYQNKVTDILYSLDSKISLNNRINQELEAMAKLIYDYWFVQFDFQDEIGNPYKSSGGKMVYNDQLKREIPEGWGVKELGDLLDCNYRNIKKEDEFEFINYLDTSNLTNNKLDELQYLSMDDKWPSRAQRVVSEGDILYSTVRPNQNHHGIIKSVVENMIGSTGFAQLRSSHKELKPDIIYTFLKSDWVTTRLHQIAELSVTSYPSISPDDILFLKMPLPDFDSGIIASLGDTLDAFYKKIDINQRENQKLSELRDWLLPMLMNGQVTIKEAEERLSMAAEPESTYRTKS